MINLSTDYNFINKQQKMEIYHKKISPRMNDKLLSNFSSKIICKQQYQGLTLRQYFDQTRCNLDLGNINEQQQSELQHQQPIGSIVINRDKSNIVAGINKSIIKIQRTGIGLCNHRIQSVKVSKNKPLTERQQCVQEYANKLPSITSNFISPSALECRYKENNERNKAHHKRTRTETLNTNSRAIGVMPDSLTSLSMIKKKKLQLLSKKNKQINDLKTINVQNSVKYKLNAANGEKGDISNSKLKFRRN